MMKIEVVDRTGRGIWREVIDRLFTCGPGQAVRVTEVQHGRNGISTLRLSSYLRTRLADMRTRHGMAYRLRTQTIGEKAFELWLELDVIQTEQLQESQQVAAQNA